MASRGRGRPRQTTHDEIRDIARDLFAARGYAATSLAEIATSAGISRTTLFSYFPAKRDLVWEEYDEGVARMTASLASTPPNAAPMDVIVAGMLVTAHYPASEREALAARWRLIRDDDDLRAAESQRTSNLLQQLIDEVVTRAPGVEPTRVDHVARALMAVAARCIEEWVRMPGGGEDLDAYVAARIAPFAAALRPLLA